MFRYPAVNPAITLLARRHGQGNDQGVLPWHPGTDDAGDGVEGKSGGLVQAGRGAGIYIPP